MTKLGGYLFDKYKALGHIETGYSIMFAICATAYIVAWIIMKVLVPKMKAVSI
jgi:ACS family hexuronate transporter-like MFS transporter